MKKKDRFLQGWRAAEQHFQEHFRKNLLKEVKLLIEGYHLSYSDEVALKYYEEKREPKK